MPLFTAEDRWSSRPKPEKRPASAQAMWCPSNPRETVASCWSVWSGRKSQGAQRRESITAGASIPSEILGAPSLVRKSKKPSRTSHEISAGRECGARRHLEQSSGPSQDRYVAGRQEAGYLPTFGVGVFAHQHASKGAEIGYGNYAPVAGSIFGEA